MKLSTKKFTSKKHNDNFIIIEDPKAMSVYSIKKLEKFITNNINNFITVGELKNELYNNKKL